MIITSLKAKNYRSFSSEVEYFPLKGVNTIVGENNVGKSNLLKILSDIVTSLNTLNIQNIQSYQNNDQEISLQCTCELSDSDIEFLLPQLGLNSKWGDDFKTIFGTEIKIEYKYSKINDQTLFIEMGYCIFDDRRVALKKNYDPYSGVNTHGWESIIRTVSKSKDSFAVKFSEIISKKEENSKVIMTVEFRKPFREYIGMLFAEKTISFPEFRVRSSNTVEENLFSSPQGNQVASVLHNLKNGNIKNRKKFKNIQTYFGDIFPNLHLDINKGQIVIEKAEEHEVTMDSIGAGIVEIIILLTHLIGIKNHIIILDEPELHLHPHAKRLVSELIKKAGQENQILCVTHSTHFIFPENIDRVTLVRDVKGDSQLTNLAPDYFSNEELKKIQRITDSEQKEFFFARAVLLVEGDTESGAIPIFANTLNLNLNQSNISVIGVDSHYFALYVRILEGFKIPHIVMLDYDTLTNIEGTIKVNSKKVKTSSIFIQLDELGKITDDEKDLVVLCEKFIVPESKHKIYEVSARTKLMPIIEKHNFIHLLMSDFEGMFSNSKDQMIIKNAKNEFKRSKVLRGKYIAENVTSIPDGISDVITKISNMD